MRHTEFDYTKSQCAGVYSCVRTGTALAIHFGLFALVVAAMAACAGCSKAQHTAAPPPDPRVRISKDDPRVILMLKELESAGPKLGLAPVTMPLAESADIRLDPSTQGAYICLFAEGMARIVHFRKAPDGYRWHGDIVLQGSNARVADELFALPDVKRVLTEWNNNKPHPAKTLLLPSYNVNIVRSASITLSNTNAARAPQPSTQK